MASGAVAPSVDTSTRERTPSADATPHEIPEGSPAQPSLTDEHGARPVIPQDELQEFSFSFSEDDLIPPSSDPSNEYKTIPGPSIASSDDASFMRSNKRRATSPDRRITVSQAVVISEERPKSKPTRSSEDSLESFKNRRHSAALFKAQNLTRSFSTLSRRSKIGLAKSQTFKENKSRTDLVTTTVLRSNTELEGNDVANNAPRSSSSPFLKWSSSSTPKSNAPSLSNDSERDEEMKVTENGPTQAVVVTVSPPESPPVEASHPSSIHANELLPTVEDTRKRHTSSPLSTSLPSPGSGVDNPLLIAPLRGTVSSDRFHYHGSSTPKGSDDMWNTFRTLEKDFQKFQSKATSFKAAFVKSRLLPFLQGEQFVPKIGPEDLERRILILNNWWEALLELLNGKIGEQIPGYDQVFLIDGLCGLMERVEWRTFPSPFCPLKQQESNGLRQSFSTTSMGSSDSDHVLESVHHNIRNLFVQNLFAQIGLAVNKMASRSTQRTFVNFAGKTCAFAFFFCPGVADTLVRLWNISPIDLRRLSKAYEIDLAEPTTKIADTIIAHFPQCLHSLAISENLPRILKDKPVLPMGMEKVEWCGSWLSRWTGREGDLFFVFVAAFHELVAEFLPPFTSKAERYQAPGLLLVHCQIFVNVKVALHRQANSQNGGTSAQPLITFDDFLDHSNPTSMGNLNSSDENRIMRLLRQILCAEDDAPPAQNHMFAEAFCDVLKAAAQSTSLYDSRACFVLLDVLEEAIPILVGFQERVLSERPFLDCKFWIDAFRKMVHSENTMTELKLYSFLYTVWDEIAKLDSWRLTLCTEFLLEEAHFYSRFNHWCPLVRSYFMRLLCWRIARFDGEESQENIYVLEMLMQNLQTVWSHFKYKVRETSENGSPPPATTPDNPAPGRRILLIRTGTSKTASSRRLHEFAVSGQSASSSTPSDEQDMSETKPNDNKSSLTPFLDKLASTFDFSPKDGGSRQNSLLRTVLGYRSPDTRSRSQSPKDASRSKSHTQSPDRSQSPRRTSSLRASLYEPRPSWQALRKDSSDAKSRSSRGHDEDLEEGLEYITANFKFSLELADRYSQPLGTDVRLYPPRFPREAQSLLESRDWLSHNVAPCAPTGDATHVATYAGRALAEWTLVVNECQNFIERRKKEGVPTDRLVETPTLGVEALRKPV